jgi:hypothetical protein
VTAALEDALAAAVAGILADEAAAGLLCGSGAFLRREDFTGRFIETAAGISDGTPMAWVRWDDAVGALDSGRLHASSGERAVLRLAASLASGSPVSLRDTVTSLDTRNLALVVTAVRHAAGRR